ncbi:amidohydrolase family protein [Agarivorans gilvus]|nr:amidohydrolase family protein [Agarivorans gilvus]
MINLAKMADDAPLYIVHLSNGLGLEYARLAINQQQKVWVETCPQYLLLDDSYYQREDGEKFILSPPLRASAELNKLWQGLSDGSIDVVATDHCSFTWREQKQPHHNDFTRCPNGIPGVELRMPLLFSEGVMKGRLSLSQFVSLTSYQPAKLFGLYPQKGCLELGADADLVIFDPQQSVSINDDTTHDACDYSPYSGLSCQGWPVMTFSRGALVSLNGQFTGQEGAGRFIARKPFKL